MKNIGKKQMIAIIGLLVGVICVVLMLLLIPVTVNVKYSDLAGTRNLQIKTSSFTVGQMLKHADELKITDKDEVDKPNNTRIKKGMTITIIKGTTKEVEINGEKMTLTLYPVTVRENLERNNISYDNDDIIKPSLDTMTDEYTNIVVAKKEVKTETVTKKVKAGTVYELDPTIDSGTIQVEKGKDGVKIYEYSTTYINGIKEKTEKKKVSDKTKKKDNLEKLGTKITGERGSVEVKETITGECTAYYPVKQSSTNTNTTNDTNNNGTDTQNGQTQTQTTISEPAYNYGTVNADPNYIPYGTKVYIEGYGLATVTNTGTSITGKNKLQLVMRSDQEAANWGSQNKKVYILK